MSDASVASEQLKVLKRKLDASIKARAEIEEGYLDQITQLTQFIGKLSQVCKGIDLKLDNKLGNLRNMLTKSATMADLEIELNQISELLKKHAATNDTNIRTLHQQFHDAGKALQKMRGLPDNLRRDLRNLLNNAEDSKDTVIQYVPLLTELVTHYVNALSAKVDAPAGGLLNALAPTNTDNQNNDIGCEVAPEIVEQFDDILGSLVVSKKQDVQLKKIRKRIHTDSILHQDIIDCFLETFSLIRENLKQERDTAESFLSSLSETLATVQSAVQSTISTNDESQKQHKKLNAHLTTQLKSMTKTVSDADSLTSVKEDIHHKLHEIAKTIQQKAKLEEKSQQALNKQLQQMQQEIVALEQQSKNFENKLHEQQLKSMQDALTQLNNRAAFDEHFAKEIVRYHNNKTQLAVVVLDLDDFKAINDTYGHTAGDKTLQVISQTMKKTLSEDIFIARYGGEEFVLIYTDISQQALVADLNRLREKIAGLPFKFKNNRVSITVSVGATHVKADDNVHIAFERADSGLYIAKEKGKNTVIYI